MNNVFDLPTHLHGIMAIHYYELLSDSYKGSFFHRACWKTHQEMLSFHIAAYCDKLVHDVMVITVQNPSVFNDFILLHENLLPSVLTIVEKLKSSIHEESVVDKLDFQHNVLVGVFMGMVTDEYLFAQLNIKREADFIFI